MLMTLTLTHGSSFHSEVSHPVFSDMGECLEYTLKKKCRVLVIFLQFCSCNSFAHIPSSLLSYSLIHALYVSIFFFSWLNLRNFNLPLLLITEFSHQCAESTNKSSFFLLFS